MSISNTKKAVRFLYDSILNTKQFERLPEIISPDYTTPFGEKGVPAFRKSILGLATAFPNAHWAIDEIISEGNIVVVKQTFTGTQTNPFQNIPPANKSVSVEGTATYQLQNGNIIRSQIQTDRLGFLQQLEVIPKNLIPTNEKTVFFVDKFLVPKPSIEEFTRRMKYNRAFIADLSGFVKDEVIAKNDSEGNSTIITIATWESMDKLNEAKLSVQAEYKRIGFDPAEFIQRLNIQMESDIYSSLME